MSTSKRELVRIGVFYDGNYFYHVSNYYNYVHERKSRISISGLHQFVRYHVAREEAVESKFCHIVDAHYFRGRISAREASQKPNQLYYDRVFDDILMSEGVITHYLPLINVGGRKEEKGIDVWLALEAYELCLHKNFDVLVLIASDGDYTPLIRKINTLGIRVMVLSWDFEYTDDDGRRTVTRTSQDLLEEVTYPVAMHEIIDGRTNRNNPIINNLFVQQETPRTYHVEHVKDSGRHRSEILVLRDGFGFIKYPPNNLFFYYGDVEGYDFNDLREGDVVEFEIGLNNRGENVAKRVTLLNDTADAASTSDDEFYEDDASDDEFYEDGAYGDGYDDEK